MPLKISEIYACGSEPGAIFACDFIEIFNNGPEVCWLGDMTLQVATTGNAWTSVALSPVFLFGGERYVVVLDTGAQGALLYGDQIVSLPISPADGVVALVDGATLLSSPAMGDPSIIDMVGWGTSDQYEGAAAPSPGPMQSLQRAGNGTQDTNSNAADFSLALPSPEDQGGNDLMPPLLVDVSVDYPGPTGAQTLVFTATFTEPVQGLSVNSVVLLATGVSEARILSIAPHSSSSGRDTTWHITVDTGAGDGTVSLHFLDSLIADETGNTFAGGDSPQVTVVEAGTLAVVTGDTTGTVIEDQTLTVAGHLHNSDGDPGEIGFMPASGLGDLSLGSFEVNASGAWQFVLTDTPAIQQLDEDTTLEDTFHIVSADGLVDTTITITIQGTNDAPTLYLAASTYAHVWAQNATWTDAQAGASLAGGHLVTFGSSLEEAYVLARFWFFDGFWIGLSDAAAEGTFTWATGEPLAYTNWEAGEPNDAGGVEDYVARTLTGGWIDLADAAGSSLAGYIVESEPAGVPTWTEGGGPITFILDGHVTDVDGTMLSGATVAITGNFVAGEDQLQFVNQLGIIGSYDDQTGILTLTGAASYADYISALQSVAYENSSNAPTPDARTLTVRVNDGASQNNLSNAQTVTINLVVDNVAPIVIDGLIAEEAPEQLVNFAPHLIANGNFFSVTDADSPDFRGGELRAHWRTGADSFDHLSILAGTAISGAAVTVTGNTIAVDSATIGTISGGAAGTDLVISLTTAAAVPSALQAILTRLAWQNTSDAITTESRFIEVTVSDGDGGTSVTSPINVGSNSTGVWEVKTVSTRPRPPC